MCLAMYNCLLTVTLLLLLYAADFVRSAHFRGAVIMARPKFGGAANEVYTYSYVYFNFIVIANSYQ